MKAAKLSLLHLLVKCDFRDFDSAILRNCNMLVCMHDFSLLYADTFVSFTLRGSAEVFFINLLSLLEWFKREKLYCCKCQHAHNLVFTVSHIFRSVSRMNPLKTWMWSLREMFVGVTELQVNSKYPFWGYSHCVEDSMCVSLAKCSLHLFAFAQVHLFYRTGLFQTSIKTSKEKLD